MNRKRTNTTWSMFSCEECQIYKKTKKIYTDDLSPEFLKQQHRTKNAGTGKAKELKGTNQI